MYVINLSKFKLLKIFKNLAIEKDVFIRPELNLYALFNPKHQSSQKIFHSRVLTLMPLHTKEICVSR